MIAAAWAAASLGAGPAAALVIEVQDGTMVLRGPIVPGDGAAFARALAEPEARGVRAVSLDSGGGKVLEGIAIGRAVRRAGLATMVDAAAARCDSACTLIFVGGVRRYYVHGETVFEGLSGRTGLGFHTAHRPGTRVEGSTLSERGSDIMRRFYDEMGVPRAADLVARAAFNTLYRPSGTTALQLGIATSLQAP
ncbi:hypothetical protein [Methylobacterium sp. JK268]